jgi:hypothetical protein
MPITPERALGYQGQNVTVEGTATVSDAHSLLGVFVRLKSPDKPRPAFAGYITPENERQFPGLQTFNGRTIDITGIVETNTGTVPLIRLLSADQMKVAG